MQTWRLLPSAIHLMISSLSVVGSVGGLGLSGLLGLVGLAGLSGAALTLVLTLAINIAVAMTEEI